MKSGFPLFSGALVVTVAVTTVAALRANQPPPAAQDDTELAGRGRATMERVCAECHGLEQTTDSRHTGQEWKGVVASMAAQGANANDEEFALITRYLTRYHGLVRVNVAGAEEFVAVLGLSSEDAAAIVEHRKSHGKFADVAALKKVPGIDTSKIDAQLEALVFE